jgi:hypothetical protein
MNRLIALALVFSTAACFPHDGHRRRLAKWSEGGAIVAGIGMLSVTSSGADCSNGPATRAEHESCQHNATIVGDIGLALILGGLVGFGITQMTADPEAAPPPKPLAAEADPDAPKPTLPKRSAVKP